MNLQATDKDGLSDGDSVEELNLLGEREFGTNPLLWDTDFDSYGDKIELDDGTDPLDRTSHPSGAMPDQRTPTPVSSPCDPPCTQGQQCCGTRCISADAWCQ